MFRPGKNFFSETPFIRVCLSIVLGVSLFRVYGNTMDPTLVGILSVGCLVLYIPALFYRPKQIVRQYKYNKVKGLLTLCCFVWIGFLLAYTYQSNIHRSHFSRYASSAQENWVVLRVNNPPVQKIKTTKTEVVVEGIFDVDTFVATSGKLLLYLQKDIRSESLQYGDQLIGKMTLSEVASPKNPNQFDYKAYLINQNIYHQSYVDSTKWIKTKTHNSAFLMNLIFEWRDDLHNIIQQNVRGDEARSIANAILLGKKDDLEIETMQAYSASGAMHVLAVSGLHVGVVYLILLLFLRILNPLKYGWLIKMSILVLCVWIYAFLTGGSPSVLRAATMFSFISVGSSLKRYVNIYNTVLGSAFVLICVNPFIVFEVGFQLSYAAVLGILFLQPKIYSLWLPKYWIIDKIWSMTSVSIAAQMATFPLGIYYFHQFPTLFLLTNLIVIPAAIAILWFGLLMFASFFVFPKASLWIGEALSYLITWMNHCVVWIQDIPYAQFQRLYITADQLVFLYIGIFLMSISLIYKSKQSLFGATIALILFVVLIQLHTIRVKKSPQLTVYSISSESVIECRTSNRSYVMSSIELEESNPDFSFCIKNNWEANHVYNVLKIDTAVFEDNQFWYHEPYGVFLDYTFVLIKDRTPFHLNTVRVDLAIIQQIQSIQLSSFIKHIKAKQYIFDSTYSSWEIKSLKEDCKELGINCYFASEKAFQKKLPL